MLGMDLVLSQFSALITLVRVMWSASRADMGFDEGMEKWHDACINKAKEAFRTPENVLCS